MKTLRILGLLLIAGVLFSCEKDIEKDVKQDVVFGINEVDQSLLKSGHEILCPDLEPTKAYIKLEDAGGNILEFNPDVIFISGKPYTKAIRLDPGTYEVMEFHLYTMVEGAKEVIMATPMAGSHYGVYVNKSLQGDPAFTFMVTAFEKLEVEIDVLCFEKNSYLEFGFFWFQINRIVVREVCFFGDFCMKSAEEYVGSLYEGQSNFPESGYYDAAAIFQIIAKKDGEPIPHAVFEDGVFTNAEWLGEGMPLCVQYPDNIDIDGEVFTFDLKILVKVGDKFEYVKFHTWTLEDDEQIPTDEFGVVDFVLGSCAYKPAPQTLVLPPYQNLPLTANVDIKFDYKDGGYWTLTIGSVLPVAPMGGYDFPISGTYLGWCGDAARTISPGAHTFYLYSSLNKVVRPWPADMPANITLESLAKVNWLMNNLKDFGYPALEGMFVEPADLDISEQQAKDLQHAIWLILGFDPANSNQWPSVNQGGGAPSVEAKAIALAAKYKQDFVPLPGGYAAVLMIKDNAPLSAQLIFTVVDP